MQDNGLLEPHLHLLLRLSPERAETWSEEEVVRRWGRPFPPRGKDRKPLPLSESWVQQKLADAAFVQKARRRLADLTLVHEVPQRTPGPYGQPLGSSDRSILELVDWTSRLVRKGKARVTAEVASLLDRLGTSAEQWQLTMSRLFLRARAVGVAFAFHREHLQEAAVKRGCHHLANLNGCPA